MSETGRRRFEALWVLYGEEARGRPYTAGDIAVALGCSEGESEALLQALIARLLADREGQTGGYRISSAGIRVIERTLFHRPHRIP